MNRDPVHVTYWWDGDAWNVIGWMRRTVERWTSMDGGKGTLTGWADGETAALPKTWELA